MILWESIVFNCVFIDSLHICSILGYVLMVLSFFLKILCDNLDIIRLVHL